MERCRVLRIEEQMYGCEELPEGAEVCCDVTVEAADGTRKTLSCPDAALIRQGIGEGDRVLWDGMELKKERNSMKKIETSALIGLGALGILFGRKMPGVKVIADAGRIARYSAQPVVCNGEECHFDYVTPEQGQPVDLLLVAVKATVLEQAIRDMKKFIGPDTIILSVLNGITSEEDIEAVYPGHCLWSVAIGMDATRVGRSLTFGAPGRIQFGEKNGEMTDRVKAVDEYLTACGIASGDFMSHKMEHEMGGMFDVTHGAGLAALWPSWARYVYNDCLPRFVRFARNVMGVTADGTDEEVALLGIDAMVDFYHSIGMPASFHELGIAPTDAQINEMARRCLEASGTALGSAKKLGLDDIIAIYHAANK